MFSQQPTPLGSWVPRFRLCSSPVHSLPHLLLFITFPFFLFSFTLLIFFYCPSDPFYQNRPTPFPSVTAYIMHFSLFTVAWNWINKCRKFRPPRGTRSSSVVAVVVRPFTSSLLRIGLTDRSFRYSLSCLWNQLFVSLIPVSLSLTHLFLSHVLLLLINCSCHPYITPSLFYSFLKTDLLFKSFPS